MTNPADREVESTDEEDYSLGTPITEEDYSLGTPITDEEDYSLGEPPSAGHNYLMDGHKDRMVVRLSDETRKKVDLARKDESFLNTPGGGPISRAITSGLEATSIVDEPNLIVPGREEEKDWYDARTGTLNYVGLLRSGIPPSQKYGILKDIARDVYGIPEDQFSKVLPAEMYHQLDQGIAAGAAKGVARTFQQATPFGEDLVRYALRKSQDFPYPKEFVTETQANDVRKMMRDGGGTIKLDGKEFEVPAKVGSDKDLNDFFQEKWAAHLRDVTEDIGESLSTFIEGTLSEGAQLTVPMIAGALTATGAGAPAGVAVGASTAMKTAKYASRFMNALINPLERATLNVLPRISARAAAVAANNPLAVSVAANAAENFAINAQDTPERLRRAALGAAIPLIPAAAKSAYVETKLMAGGNEASVEARKNLKLQEAVNSVARLRDMLGEKTVNKIIAGEVKAPSMGKMTGPEVAEQIAFQTLSNTTNELSKRQVASQVVRNMVFEAGEESPIITHLDNFLAVTGEGSIKSQAAADAYSILLKNSHPETRKILEADTRFHQTLAMEPEADPVKVMEMLHPNSARVFADTYERVKYEKRTDALLQVVRASTSPASLDVIKNAAKDIDRDVGGEHSIAKLELYNKVVDLTKPKVEEARAEYNKMHKSAVLLRDEIIGEIDGLISQLDATSKTKKPTSRSQRAYWASLQKLFKETDTIDIRSMPTFRVALAKALRVADTKLKSKTNTVQGQAIADRANSIKLNMARYDKSLSEMNAHIETIRNYTSSSILSSRMNQLDFGAMEGVKPTRDEVAIIHFTNPSQTARNIKGLIDERLSALATNRVFNAHTTKLGKAPDLLAEAVTEFVHDIRESSTSNVVFSLSKLHNVRNIAEEVLGKRHAATSGIRQIVAVAEAMQRDNDVIEKMQATVFSVPDSRVPSMLPTIGALADQLSTYSGLAKASAVLTMARESFNHHMGKVLGISEADAHTRFEHLFSILAGDTKTKLQLKQDPNIPVSTDSAVLQMFDAADVLSAETIRSILGEFKKVLGVDLDIETFLSQFAVADNLYASNRIFETRLADVDKYREQYAHWKNLRKQYANTSRFNFVNTEMAVQMMMRAAPVADAMELEQFAGGIKVARYETTQKHFKSDMQRIFKNYVNFWSDKNVANAANAIMGLDGLSDIGFMYRNSFSDNGLQLEPAGMLVKKMFSAPSEENGKVVNLSLSSTTAIKAVVDYSRGYEKYPNIMDSRYAEDVVAWQKKIIPLVDSLAESNPDAHAVMTKLIVSKEADGIPPILRYFARHEVFGDEAFARPATWEHAWNMVEEDAATRRKLYKVQLDIYAAEREKYKHLKLQLHPHAWFERYITQRSTKETMATVSSDRIYHRQIPVKMFKTTEEGQLAKTAGLGLRTGEGTVEVAAHPMVTLFDDLMIGVMEARTSHSKEFLRQRGILLEKMQLSGIASWMVDYYKHDLRDRKRAQQIEEVAKAVARLGQTAGTVDAIRSARIGLPPLARLVLGGGRIMLSLSRPGSTLFRQPVQQATTSILASGPRDIDGLPTNAFKTYATFLYKTFGKFFTKYEDLHAHHPSNYQEAMNNAMDYFRDASDTRTFSAMKRLMMGESKPGVMTRLAYAEASALGKTEDFVTTIAKENSEISMTSIVIEMGAGLHRQIVKDAIKLKSEGYNTHSAGVSLMEKYGDAVRTKAANEIYAHMQQIAKEAFENGEDILNGGPKPQTLLPFLTFYVTNSVTRFGTLANPMVINNYRALFPNDLRFFAARFNNMYLAVGAAMPLLRKANRAMSGNITLTRNPNSALAMQSIWKSRFSGVPEQLSGSMSLLMTGAALHAVGAIMEHGIGDIPFVDDAREASDESKSLLQRKLIANIKEPIGIVKEIGELILPISSYRLGGAERGVNREIEGAIGTFANFLSPEAYEMYINLNRLAEATQSIPGGLGTPNTSLMFTKYDVARKEWIEANELGDKDKIAVAERKMKDEYKKYELLQGSQLLNYGFSTVLGADLLYKPLPWMLVRYLHLCEAERLIYENPSARMAVTSDPKYYSEFREITSTLGILDSEPFAERAAPVAELIYGTLLKNGHISKKQYYNYTEYVRKMVNMIDEEAYANFVGTQLGVVRQSKKEKDAAKSHYEREQLLRGGSEDRISVPLRNIDPTVEDETSTATDFTNLIMKTLSKRR